uniref:Nuclear control of ATPase protein 2 n=1 Tax=Amorphochlora amoebiformis TaxID=1561963 RepID=A0A7S0DTH7_9EUKA
MGVKSVPSPGGGERGKELCIQALILGNARLADAMTRVSRDAILVSIETSVLPRLQRWTKQRQQLERNRQFLRRFYRIVFTLKRAGRWCVDTGKMLSKLPQRVPMLRRLSERNKKPKSKLYDIPSAYSDAMKKPKARKTETSSRAAIESDWQDRIERCEQAIEYLQTVMRQQYRALGAVHTQLWFRPELSTHLGENIGSEKLMALQNWTSKAYKVCYEALCSPVSIAQGKKSEGLAIKAESIVRKAQGYGNGVDICLKANDELRLSRWEKAERFFPTLITLLIGCALHFVMPASPAALGSILAGAYQRARSAGRAMWRRNVVRPAKAIVNDVWFQSRPKIVTPGAISDAKDSLQIMMRDFAEKAYPKMSQEELEERVQAMDMSLISGEYNKQVKNTILNLPKIPQAVLVQVQFLKVVLLATMEAIDDLYGANQINLQLLASIPALLVSFFLLRLGLRLIWVTSTRKVATAKWIHSKMRRHLREIERILLLNTGKLSLMGEGKIVFEAWRFSRTLETYWAYFPSSERASLRSDIGDLITNGMSNAEDYPIDQTLPLGLQGSQIQSINKEIFGDSIMVLGSGMDIWQRLKICERLRGSHRFLSKQSAGDSSASIPT